MIHQEQFRPSGRDKGRRIRAIWMSIAAVAILAPVSVSDVLAARMPADGADQKKATDTDVSIAAVRISGSHPMWEADRGRFTPTPAGHPAVLRLGAGLELDPSSAEPEDQVPERLRAAPVAGAERGYFLVQFRGPIEGADKALIEGLGGELISYIPDYAFLVSLTGGAREEAARNARVAWTGAYHPAYKISRNPLMGESGTREMIVLLFPGESVEDAASEIARAGGEIQQTYDNGINKMVRFILDTSRIEEVARIRAVSWIEPFTYPTLNNNQCQWVVQTWVNNNRRIWDLGIRGEGQIVSLCDSGIRTTHRQFYDAAVPITWWGDFPTHRKVTAYKKALDIADILFGDNVGSGYHGTHTACTAAGSDDPYLSDNRDGMAKEAKIYFIDGGGTGTTVWVPADLNDLLIMPYEGNAAGSSRIMTNSWSRAVAGEYDIQAMTADQFMWNHPDFLAFFSNGNSGGVNTVGSPATAKNVVSAGGTLNGTQANQLYTSTSRGPTDDGRYKPTICAPASLSSANGGGDTGYVTYQGTSMASPAMAGATVQARQYLTEGWYPTGTKVPANAMPNPSAALMKAIAINSADPNVAGGNVPNNNIGWGRILLDDALYFAGDTRRLAIVDFADGLLTGEYVEFQVYVASSGMPLKAALVWTDYPGNPAASRQLVNDLNLIATDGVSTYRGNNYSGGQSIPGGSADILNVEECVRRDAPTIGIWTFRIEGFNIPFGPQQFALVISGGLASDAGLLTLDKGTYGVDDATIRLVDLNAGASVTVTATSQTEPGGETVTLPGSNGVYQGTLRLRPTLAAGGDGDLSVSHGDQVTVTYNDLNPVTTLIARAAIDLTGSRITNVSASALSGTDARIEWTTDGATNSKVYYGTTPALGQIQEGEPVYGTAHTVVLRGLTPDQTYYYDVESADRQGNAVRDDNGGLHYTVTTDGNRDVLLVIGDATFDKLARYQNAFTRTGWTYTTWEGAQAATPFVGDRMAGMASFRAVIWQTGYEQYPMFTDAGRDSIARLNDLGSRLAVFSHDVAWDFCDTGSPDYSVARCQWMRDELKALYQEDPATWSLVRGIAGDPISGGYTSGISYTPHRAGAAGDEIDGVADGGSFAYVWRNNDTVADDIALRWTSSAPVGDPARAVWGGTPNKVSSNFFEWAQLNNVTNDDPVRADVLDKTLIWLIGRDHPNVDLTAPAGGETFTGSTISISWTEPPVPPTAIAERLIFYSDNGGGSWNLITNSPGSSPYSWDIASIPNGQTYRIRILVRDDGTPVLRGLEDSGDFTINRPGGDTRGPRVVAGSMLIVPLPALKPNPVTLTATLSDVLTGNGNVVAAEWSRGANPAPAGSGAAMGGTFGNPVANVSVVIDSRILTPGTDILWVRGRDAAGSWGPASSFEILVNANPAGVEDAGLPVRFALHANQPNPFNPITLIRFDLPKGAEIDLRVFDVAGRLVRTLREGETPAGRHGVVWDGRDEVGHAVPSGIYFYRLKAGGDEAVRRMTLLK